QPEVIVGGVEAKRGRQLHVASGDAEHAVTDEAIAEVVAVELRRADRTALSMVHIAGGAVGVGELPLEVVTLLEIEPGTDARSPAQLVGRMAADLGTVDRASRRAVEEARGSGRAGAYGCRQRPAWQ